MNMADWIDGLVASYPHHRMTKSQNSEYRQELQRWPLSSDEWLELKTLARQRHPNFFPNIGELEEIMREVKRRRRPASNRAFRTWKDDEGRSWAQPLPGKTYDDFEPCSVEEAKKVFAKAFLEAGGKPELLAKMQGLIAAREMVEEKAIEDEMGQDALDWMRWR